MLAVLIAVAFWVGVPLLISDPVASAVPWLAYGVTFLLIAGVLVWVGLGLLAAGEWALDRLALHLAARARRLETAQKLRVPGASPQPPDGLGY